MYLKLFALIDRCLRLFVVVAACLSKVVVVELRKKETEEETSAPCWYPLSLLDSFLVKKIFTALN